MFAGLAVLLACQAAGEFFAASLHVPLPGPVLGMALLAVVLAAARRLPVGLAQTSGVLLKAMPLFFIPAGVGVMTLKTDQRRQSEA